MKDYIKIGESETQYVHTAHLTERLQEWFKITQLWDQDRKSKEHSDLLSCLELARGGLRALEAKHAGFDHVIKVSLNVIYDTVVKAVQRALNPPGHPWSSHSICVDFQQSEVNLMLRNGWCPAEISHVEQNFRYICPRFYLRHMRRPTLDIDHSGCTREGCLKLQVDLKTYRPLHVDKSCQCSSMGPNLEQVKEYLEKGTFPVLKVVGDSMEGFSVEVLPYADDVAYVALSHVWVDGLGNPEALTLPQCQLLRLRSLVGGLRGRTFAQPVRSARGATLVEKREERDLYIWCDSLCCPIDDRKQSQGGTNHKKLALAKLKEVYENAAYVLVLDRALQSFRYLEIGSLEAAVRILTSAWMRRLCESLNMFLLSRQ